MRVSDHLAGRSPETRRLYRSILAAVRRVGPVRVDPQGRGIAFQVRARSIGVMFRRDSIDLGLWLKHPIRDARVTRVEEFGALGRAYHFPIRRPEDLDAALLQLVRQAYAVGAQEVPTIRRAPASADARRRAGA